MPVLHVRIGEEEIAIATGSIGTLQINGEQVAVQVRQRGARSFSVLLDRQSHSIVVVREDDKFTALVNGVTCDVTVETDRMRLMKSFESASHAEQTRLEIHAPMPALVAKVEVAVGDVVEKGTGLLVLEAMKMENEIKAHHAARVKEVYVTKGKAVEKGELLMLLEE